jgi:hypothetical protein
MSSLVLDLLRDALDENTKITSLLRKARVIAQKLDIPELVAWTECELNGYETKQQAVPEYRRVKGDVKSWNPYNGIMCPIIWTKNPPEYLITRLVGQGASELLDLLDRRDNKDLLTIGFPESVGYQLMQQSNMPTPPVLVVERAQIVGILDTVRNIVSDWAVKLEQQGILGEGMTFSPKEKNIAMKNTNIHIANFQGVLGDVSKSTLTQNLTQTITKLDFESLSAYLESIGVTKPDVQKLKESIAADDNRDPKSGFGAKVSGWIGKMVSKAADGSWNVALGASANLLSDAIKTYYGIP